ncbi:ImmA/IrrE family metallo-endopeptidase [Saccharicrinis sp. FJH62]|uniref:ImmA/IrrE family metallo-endopeptidase n=1 Tax=Saccharicrinis sp. FJH62 TaxID=3344657 RepID=UPI0035D4296E
MMNKLSSNRGQIEAINLLNNYGIKRLGDDITLEMLIYGLGGTIIYKDLSNCDGRIIFGKRNHIIEINNSIQLESKINFTLAHELGHLLMHKGAKIHEDTEKTTTWFNSIEKQAKEGILEFEANQFASELLMPTELFIEKQKGKKFSPDLLRELADYFKSSITATTFKYFEYGAHPVCLFHCYNNIVKYWKWPDGYPHYIIDRTRLAPPEDSVAAEFFNEGKIYKKRESKQQVWKSTWFELRDYEDDRDYNFYEYCIATQKYNTALSVVWEELK